MAEPLSSARGARGERGERSEPSEPSEPSPCASYGSQHLHNDESSTKLTPCSEPVCANGRA